MSLRQPKGTMDVDATNTKRPGKRPRAAHDAAARHNGGRNDTTSESTSESNDAKQQTKRKSNSPREEGACGRCLLCRTPRCGHCFPCVFQSEQTTEGKEGQGETGRCLRKLRPAAPLGFPPGWSFAFDDPTIPSPVFGPSRPLSLAGLRLASPSGGVFRSLAAAIDRIAFASAEEAVDLVARFLVHVGSSRHMSDPDHFLVGKGYSHEFTTANGATVVLFGKVAACLRPAGGSEDDLPVFFVQYDGDARSMANGTGVDGLPSLQIVDAGAAWGGGVAFERRSHRRRGPDSVIRSVDQSTPVETWVAPDARVEEVVEGTDGTRLPRLIVVARGYKFVFGTRAVDWGGAQQRQCGVFATCTPLHDGSDGELNLKPGELIDLGVFAPLRPEDETSLAAFVLKDYLHSFTVGRWGVVAGQDDVAHDLTDDATGELHEIAARSTLSHVRTQRTKGPRPTIHARYDPGGKVHFLFGILYEGNWAEYGSGMRQLAPLFGGGEVEATVDWRHGLGKRAAADAKCLESMGVFQMQDIVACRDRLERLLEANASEARPPAFVERAKRAVDRLEERSNELLTLLADVQSRENEDMSDVPDVSSLVSARDYFQKLQEGWKR
ncbi:hypothetical protein ACHAXT_002671 [Thalassiosira profunda]